MKKNKKIKFKKKNIMVIGIVLILIFIILFLFLNREVKIQNIKSFRYFQYGGFHINDRISYEIQCEDKRLATILEYGVPEDEAFVVEVSSENIEKLENILVKYHVGRWDGFSKKDKHIMDGNGFTLEISMEDGKQVLADGYMKWPKNYDEVLKEILKFFKSI